MPLITSANGTPTDIDGAGTSLTIPTFEFIRTTATFGNEQRVYDVTANSTGVTLNSVPTDDNGGVLIDNGGSLTLRQDTIVTNRIGVHQSNSASDTVLDAEDCILYITGTAGDVNGSINNYPSGFLSSASQNIRGTFRLHRTNVFSTFDAPNAAPFNNQNVAPAWGNNGGNGFVLIADWEDVIFGPINGGEFVLNLGGLDTASSTLTRVTVQNGVIFLAPRRWISVGTTFRQANGIVTRTFGSGSTGYALFAETDMSRGTGADARILIDDQATNFYINPLVPSAGINVFPQHNGGSKSLYSATILSSNFIDPVSNVAAADALIKFENNRTISRGTAFNTTLDLPALTAAASITQFRSQIAGYTATQAEDGLVVVRDPLSANAENSAASTTTNMGPLVPITSAPSFKAWSYTHNTPWENDLNSFVKTGDDGNSYTFFGTQIDDADVDSFVATETYSATEDEFVKNASGVVVPASTYLDNILIQDGTARTDYQIQNLQELYRTMKALWYTQNRNIDFTTAVSVDDDLNLVLSGDFSLNASGNRAFWHNGTLNRFAIGKATTGTPLAAVPGVLEGIVVQGELPLPDTASTLTASVSSATDDITGMPDSVGSADARITISAGGRFRWPNDRLTTAKIFTNVDITDGDLDVFPTGSSFTNCTVPATVRVTSNVNDNPVGSFTIDGGTYGFELSNLAAGNHTWTINNSPTLNITGIPTTPSGVITINADVSATRTVVLAWLNGLGATIVNDTTSGNGYYVPEPPVSAVLTVRPTVSGRYGVKRVLAGAALTDFIEPTDMVAGQSYDITLNSEDGWLDGDYIEVWYKYDSTLSTQTVYQEGTFRHNFEGPSPANVVAGAVQFSPQIADAIVGSTATSTQVGSTRTLTRPTTSTLTVELAGYDGSNSANQFSSLAEGITIANQDNYFDHWFDNRAAGTPLLIYAEGSGVAWEASTGITFQSGDVVNATVPAQGGGTADVVIPSAQGFTNWSGFVSRGDRGTNPEVSSIPAGQATLTSVVAAAEIGVNRSSRLETVDGNVNDIETIVNEIQTNVDAIETKIDTVDTVVDEIAVDTDTLRKFKLLGLKPQTVKVDS